MEAANRAKIAQLRESQKELLGSTTPMKGLKGVRLGGRQKGVPNRSTRELREFAQLWTEEAILQIVKLMRCSHKEETQLAAARELLVRGYGNPVTLSGEDGGAIPVTVEGIQEELKSIFEKLAERAA
jgi:hypothetical protein